MLNFHEKYRPLTSRPFLSGHSYQEYIPSQCLRPYICCFWSAGPDSTGDESPEVVVIPDTCMDMILQINHSKQTISAFLSSMYDTPFISVSQPPSDQSADRISVFAVRFFFWSAHLFFNLDFKEIQNKNFDLKMLGIEWEVLFERFFYLHTVMDQIAWAEMFLQGKLEGFNCHDILLNSFHLMVSDKWSRSVKEICEYCCVSQRQLERLFSRTVGLPMKRVSSLIRYQNIWRDMLYLPHFDIQDAVLRYGYTDQSHLLKDFKRFHGTTPTEAKGIAYRNI